MYEIIQQIRNPRPELNAERIRLGKCYIIWEDTDNYWNSI